MKILTEREFAEGYIPKKEDFAKALAEFEKACIFDRHGQIRDEIYGALFFGSVVRGEFNIDSDIDCLLVVNDPDFERHIQETNQRINGAHNIIVETRRIIPLEKARKGDHTIKINFYNQLLAAKELYGFIGQDPLEALLVNKNDVRKAVRETLVHHEEDFRGRYGEDASETSHLHLLKDILTQPVNCLRELIQYHLNGPIIKDGKHLDRFTEQRDYFYDLFAPKNRKLADQVLHHLQQIREVRQRYTCLLEKRLSHSFDEQLREERERVLDRIFDGYKMAKEVASISLELIG